MSRRGQVHTAPLGARPAGALVALLCLLALGSACALLPERGSVHPVGDQNGPTTSEPPYVAPAGPRPGADRMETVRGFLASMQASPVDTATARTFLSARAQQAWRPGDGTVVYDALALAQQGSEVVARLSDVHRLDMRGSWAPERTRGESIRFRLVREKGQWRIDNPVSALMVRSSYFEDQFLLFDLYFFDLAGRVVVPDPVYVPRGQQTATTLVRGLLDGPDPRLATVVRSAFPAGAELDPAVVVTERGVAEVPLGPEVLRLSAEELNRAMVQLAWTLRPVAGIERVRITVGGTPVALPDGRTDLSVDEGAEFAPTGLGASRELVGLHEGRVVTVAGGDTEPVAGGLGRPGLALRSVVLDRSGGRVAVISADGATASTAATDPASPAVQRVFETGHDLLRPAYDPYGTLWLLDRTSRGAQVYVVRNGRARRVQVPGVSGRRVTSFAISPDGTRLAVGLDDRLRPRVRIAAIRRGPSGRVTEIIRANRIGLASYDPSHELGPVVDVGWRTPTQLAVLTKPPGPSSRVVFAMADGSPGDGFPPLPDPLGGTGTALVVSADAGLPLLVLDDHGRLIRLDAAGKWETTAASKLGAAAYAS